MFTAPANEIIPAETKPQTGFTAPTTDVLSERVQSEPVEKLAADSNFKPEDAYNSLGESAGVNPEMLDKLTQVFILKQHAPTDWGKIAASAVTAIPHGIADFARGLVEVPVTAAKSLAGAATGDTKAQTQGAGELAAAVEQGSTTTAGLLHGLAVKAGDKITGGPKTPQEWQQRFLERAADRKQMAETQAGRGEMAKATGLDADQVAQAGGQIDPEKVGRMGMVLSPDNLFIAGKGLTLGKAAAEGALKTVAKEGLVDAAKQAAGRGMQAVGGGVADVATKVGGKNAAVVGAVLAGAGHAVAPGTGALAAGGLVKGAQAGGRALEYAGKVLTGEAANGPLGRLARAAAGSAAHGAAVAAPFAAGADYEDEAGQMLGAGVGLGAAAGAVGHTAAVASHEIATRAFQEAGNAEPIANPPQGTDPTLEKAHQDALTKLREIDPPTANIIDRLRTVLPAISEATKPGEPAPELYVLDKPTYEKVFDGSPAKTQEGYFDASNNRLVIKLDGSNADALYHEPGHLIFNLMPAEEKHAVFSEIEKAYGEDGLNRFAQSYEEAFNKNLPANQRKSLDLKNPADRDYLLNEISAENLSAVLRGDTFSGESPSVARQLGEHATRVLEMLGLYRPDVNRAPNGSTTTKLGVGVSTRVTRPLAEFFRAQMGTPEVAQALDAASKPTSQPAAAAPTQLRMADTATPLPASAPKAPGFRAPAHEIIEHAEPVQPGLATPVPGKLIDQLGGFGDRPFSISNPDIETQKPTPSTAKPTIRAEEIPASKPANLRGVTDEQISKLSTERDDMNIAPAAEAVKNGTPEEQKAFSEIVNVLKGSTRGNTPMLEVTYRSIKSEGNPNAREARRTEQESGRAAEAAGSTDERAEATKRIVPTGFKVTQEGRAQLFGQSADKVIAAVNDGIVSQAAEKNISDKVPYENAGGKLTGAGADEFLKDLSAYIANQANGYRGDGEKLVRPANYGGILPPENKDFKPTSIPEDRANFVNMVVAGGELIYPKTNRVKKDLSGVTIKPANIRARELAEANLKPAIEPGKPGPKDQSYADFGGTKIAEFNPLRQEFEKAGVDVRKNFIGAPETLNLSDIVSVKQVPGRAFQAPSIDLTRAGFMPRTESVKSADEVRKLSPEEFAAATRTWKGGLTGQAIELGKRTPKSELPVLEAYRDEAHQKFGEYRAARNLDSAMAEASRGQFFREAAEAHRAANGEEGLSIRPQDAERAYMPNPDKPFTKADLDEAQAVFNDAMGRAARLQGQEGFAAAKQKFEEARANLIQIRKAVTGGDIVDQGRTRFMPAPNTPEFKSWFGKSQVVDEEGNPRIVYHGTTRDFHIFDKEKVSPESDMGAAFYFSSTPGDVAKNYARLGPDLKNKLEREAERIAGETDRDYNDPAVRREARANLMDHRGQTKAVYLKMENPIRLGGKEETYLDYHQPMNEEGDFEGEPTGTLAKFLDRLNTNAMQHSADASEVISKVLEHGGYEGIRASELFKILKEDETLGYAEDGKGNLSRDEVIRQSLEDAGFDGIIDRTVNEKFGTQKKIGKPMVGMNRNTVHYVVFNPEQVKSVFNQGAFNPNNPDIRFMPQKTKSLDGVEIRPRGSEQTPYERLRAAQARFNSASSDKQQNAAKQKLDAAIKAMRPDTSSESQHMPSEAGSKSGIQFMPKFFSQLENVINSDKVPERATPEQIRGMLRNPQNGIKADELKWSGIEEFLAGKDKVSKKDLQDFLAQNRIEIHEVEKKSEGDTGYVPTFENAYHDVNAFDEGEEHHSFLDGDYRIETVVPEGTDPKEYRAHNGFIVDREVDREMGNTRAIGNARTFQEAVELAADDAAERGGDGEGDTKFSKYTLPGGKNYREVLFTLPPNFSLPQKAKETPAQIGKRLFGDEVPLYDRPTEQQKQIEAEVHKTVDMVDASTFESSHWDEKNVLAHARTAEHETSDGKPVLLAEEIQSDWHQAGRKYGYRQPLNIDTVRAKEAEIKAAEEELSARRSEGAQKFPELVQRGQIKELREAFPAYKTAWERLQTLKEDFSQFMRSEGFVVRSGNTELGRFRTEQAAQDFADAHRGRTGDIDIRVDHESGADAVPDAPFKNTWPEFVFKNLLHEAVTEGKDYLAWTPGKLQAERYDLSKQINRLYYFKNENGTYTLEADLRNGGQHEFGNIPADKLEDHVGKDVAQRIIAGEGGDARGEDRAGFKFLKEDGLKVGGAGMKGFYDDILVKFANKYAKKWGSKVGQVTLHVPDDEYHITESSLGGGSFHVRDKNSGIKITFGSREDAQKWIDENSKLDVWALPITEAMRKSVPEGQPQFMPAQAPTSSAPIIRPAKASNLGSIAIRAKQPNYQQN